MGAQDMDAMTPMMFPPWLSDLAFMAYGPVAHNSKSMDLLGAYRLCVKTLALDALPKSTLAEQGTIKYAESLPHVR